MPPRVLAFIRDRIHQSVNHGVMRSTMLLLLLSFGLLGAGSACSVYSIQAALAAMPPLPLSPGAYTTDQVVDALEGLGSTNHVFINPHKTTYACVDARGAGLVGGLAAVPTLETPGGDFAELQALIVAYHRVKGTPVTGTSVNAIFTYFMHKIASTKRPFYLHTADSNLQTALKAYTNLTGETVHVVPLVEPMNKTASDAWYSALTLPTAQGCGHVRYMMLYPNLYDLNTPAEASVPTWLIKAFFKYWWPTPEGNSRRTKVVYPILQGTLGGGALLIVNNVGPGCPGSEPDLAPFHGGSSMFLYASNAVAAFRRDVLMPFIKQYDRRIDALEVLQATNALQAKQLNATLYLLSPLNALPIYNVNVTASYIRKDM